MGQLEALDPLLEDRIQDQLYRDKKIVENIVALVNENVRPPYSIAISGSWGSGKTMLLKLIENELGEKLRYPTVWFNPWEYDNSGNVVLSLQRCVALAFKDRFGISLKELGIFGLTLVTSGIDTIARITTNGCVTYANIKEIQGDVRDALGTTGYDAYKDEVVAIKKDFAELTSRVSSKYRGKPLILFFDDLDRCLPENALSLLEALKNLFVVREAKVVVISAIDTGVAKSFIKKRYEGIEDDFAINYFRKIFNLTLQLPSKTAELLRTYLTSYIERLFKTESNEAESGLEGELPRIKCVTDIMMGMASVSGTQSLRVLLNTINNYFVVRRTTESTLNHKDVLPFLFLKEVWHEFYEQLKGEALNLEGMTINRCLEADKVKVWYGRDERLQRFWSKFVESDALVLELMKANII